MPNKDILLTALNYREPKRVPWVPYVGVHAAKLIGKSADEFLHSDDLIYEGVMKSIDEYRPDRKSVV